LTCASVLHKASRQLLEGYDALRACFSVIGCCGSYPVWDEAT
jgi:hypothetical protein